MFKLEYWKYGCERVYLGETVDYLVAISSDMLSEGTGAPVQILDSAGEVVMDEKTLTAKCLSYHLGEPEPVVEDLLTVAPVKKKK